MVIEVVFYLSYDAIFNVNNLISLVSYTTFMRHYNNRFVVFGIEFLYVLLSKAPVGSSASIICGCVIKARAMATLCFCPPDISLG
mgnify:CR=1 FL=1